MLPFGPRRGAPLAALIAAVVLTGCSRPGPHPSRGAASPLLAPSDASPAAWSGHCPVTRSTGAQPAPVARLNFGTVLTSSKEGWIGNGGLWAELPSYGVLLTTVQSGTPGSATKFGWFRATPGQVSVSGTPVGGPPAPFHSEVGTVPEYDRLGNVRGPGGTGLVGVAPSNIFKSSDDKWMVIAANADAVFRRLCGAMEQPELADDPITSG